MPMTTGSTGSVVHIRATIPLFPTNMEAKNRFKLYADKTNLTLRQRERLTSGICPVTPRRLS